MVEDGLTQVLIQHPRPIFTSQFLGINFNQTPCGKAWHFFQTGGIYLWDIFLQGKGAI